MEFFGTIMKRNIGFESKRVEWRDIFNESFHPRFFFQQKLQNLLHNFPAECFNSFILS